MRKSLSRNIQGCAETSNPISTLNFSLQFRGSGLTRCGHITIHKHDHGGCPGWWFAKRETKVRPARSRLQIADCRLPSQDLRQGESLLLGESLARRSVDLHPGELGGRGGGLSVDITAIQSLRYTLFIYRLGYEPRLSRISQLLPGPICGAHSLDID